VPSKYCLSVATHSYTCAFKILISAATHSYTCAFKMLSISSYIFIHYCLQNTVYQQLHIHKLVPSKYCLSVATYSYTCAFKILISAATHSYTCAFKILSISSYTFIHYCLQNTVYQQLHIHKLVPSKYCISVATHSYTVPSKYCLSVATHSYACAFKILYISSYTFIHLCLQNTVYQQLHIHTLVPSKYCLSVATHSYTCAFKI
jgi:hypothetical protein